MTLDDIASGDRVFADATVFVYHFTAASAACRRFLERCQRADVKAVTSVTALAEISHRLMMLEAVSRGLVSPGNVAKKLRKKPGAVKKLRAYDENVRRIPLMGVDVRVLDLKTLSNASALRTEYGLLVNDSIIAASAVAAGVEIIATADRDFDRVSELTVAGPGDLDAG